MAGRAAERPLDVEVQMALAGEPDRRRHFNDDAPGPQKLPRTLHPATDDILVRRYPGGRLEQPGEVKRASLDKGRQNVKCERRVEVAVDMPIQSGQLLIREPGHGFVRLGTVGVLTTQVNAEGGCK